jgi:iron complex outermembrane receptor protein
MMTNRFLMLGTAAMIALLPPAALADGRDAADPRVADTDDTVVVTGTRTEKFAGTKTDTPLIETPQPITVITEDTFRAQGAINIADTVRYAAGVNANPYGRDTRVDGFQIRGLDALQFRDGMRDIFSYYASITSDPYNFSRVEIVRGPASVLFGQASLGGLVNLVSKTPEFETRGELQATYGSYDRKEVMGDVNVALAGNLAVRLVGRARDADTYVDSVPDDRVFVAPSIRWQPTPDTDITLLGLYQDDHGGSTSQFLPIVGTLRDNPGNPKLDDFLFVGKPGWDRYDGRSLQGGGSITQHFGDAIQISLKARYIDSNVSYFTHYTNSYSSPTDPYLDASRRQIGLYADSTYARMNVFSTDNNAQFTFDTGAAMAHKVLAGVDYSWNKVSKQYGFDLQTIDLYNIDRNAILTPEPTGDWATESQKQLGFYLQDQIAVWDRIHIVLGARRDRLESTGGKVDTATTFRAGIIGELGANISPFFSYTESFLPVAGLGFTPQRGKQFEVGAKWQPDPGTLVTVTGFHIEDTGRLIAGPTPNTQVQAGKLTSKGFEVEATRTLPGNFDVVVSYGYNEQRADENPAFNFVPKHNASIWSTKTFPMPGTDASLRLGAGVRYTGESSSVGATYLAPPTAQTWTITTPANTVVDALAEVTWRNYRFSVNATNLFDNRFYASCLARGDCFVGAPRNVMATLGVRF